MRPRAIDSRIASAVGPSVQTSAGTNSARLACGCRSRTRSSKRLPAVRENDAAASTSATSPPPLREPSERPQRLVRIGDTFDAIVAPVPLDERGLDVVEGVPVLVDGEQERLAHRPATITAAPEPVSSSTA